MNSSDDRERIVAFASKLARRIVFRVKHSASLRNLEPEDIEQELLAYVWEHADKYSPSKGNIEAFATKLTQTAIAKLLRKANRLRSNPPKGTALESLSKSVEGPHRKSEELTKGLASTDRDRRRQIVSLDPLQNIDLADAVEHQIQTLPHGCRRIARLLCTCSQAEIAIQTGLSKRKISDAISTIRQHFSRVEWEEITTSWVDPTPNCIASTREDVLFPSEVSSKRRNIHE